MANGALEELPSRPDHVCAAFMVPKHDGGWRLVVDLRPLNVYFPVCKVHYETLSWLSSSPRSVTSAASIDLRDCYHHFRLHTAIRKHFNFEMNGKYYRCVALPFGWSLAPAFCTKLLRPVIAILRLPSLAVLPASWLLR